MQITFEIEEGDVVFAMAYANVPDTPENRARLAQQIAEQEAYNFYKYGGVAEIAKGLAEDGLIK